MELIVKTQGDEKVVVKASSRHSALVDIENLVRDFLRDVDGESYTLNFRKVKNIDSVGYHVVVNSLYSWSVWRCDRLASWLSKMEAKEVLRFDLVHLPKDCQIAVVPKERDAGNPDVCHFFARVLEGTSFFKEMEGKSVSAIMTEFPSDFARPIFRVQKKKEMNVSVAYVLDKI